MFKQTPARQRNNNSTTNSTINDANWRTGAGRGIRWGKFDGKTADPPELVEVLVR